MESKDNLHRAGLIRLIAVCAMLAAAAVPIPANSQNLPAPGRAIFKCEIDGRTVYTDQPCIGTRISGTEPAQGIDQPTDSERNGTDVPRGMGPAPYGAHRSVLALAQSAKAECPHLAQRMTLVEAEEQVATSRSILLIQERLSIQRKRYRELGC